jgi:hypothetical protein
MMRFLKPKVFGKFALFVNVTAWLASMEIAVTPAVWMFNTPLVSAVVTTPAVVDALIDEANLFS